MRYIKPEITGCSSARRVIEAGGPKQGLQSDGMPGTNPGYEADE